MGWVSLGVVTPRPDYGAVHASESMRTRWGRSPSYTVSPTECRNYACEPQGRRVTADATLLPQILYETTQDVAAGAELLLGPREPLHLDMLIADIASAEDRSDRESGEYFTPH